MRQMISAQAPQPWLALPQSPGGAAKEWPKEALAPTLAAFPGGAGEAPEPSCRERAWTYWPTVACITASVAVVLLGSWFLTVGPGRRMTEPYWEVTQLEIYDVDIPGLMMKGIAPANTALCPVNDLCGVGPAKGCSVCPEPGMFNSGCLCTDTHGRSAPEGYVVQADVSKCPMVDKCGIGTAKGCSVCPDASWVNDGCACRQPLSPEEFFDRVGGFLGSLLGLKRSIFSAKVNTSVTVVNPAPAGAEAEPGTFAIMFKDTVIGTATTDRVWVQPRSSTAINVVVSVDDVPRSVGMRMLKEILEHSFNMGLIVDGNLTVKVPLARVAARVSCALMTDVSQVPVTGAVRFTEKVCEYHYGLEKLGGD